MSGAARLLKVGSAVSVQSAPPIVLIKADPNPNPNPSPNPNPAQPSPAPPRPADYGDPWIPTIKTSRVKPWDATLFLLQQE